jgi:hypothetical protein
VTFGAPVIGTPGTQVGVGEFGIEGSKPGAAPAAVYLSHAVLRPSSSGYGQLLNEVMRSTKALYLRIATMSRFGDPFVCVPLARLPSQRDGIGNDDQWLRAIAKLSAMPLDEVIADPHLRAELSELGPDQNIVDYTFNLRDRHGRINTDLARCQDLNARIYKAFHVQEGTVDYERPGVPDPHIDYGDDIQKYPLIITQTQMSTSDYGAAFIADYATRLGLVLPTDPTAQTLFVNRTVCMDPWLTHAADERGLFLDTVLATLHDEVARLANEMLRDDD